MVGNMAGLWEDIPEGAKIECVNAIHLVVGIMQYVRENGLLSSGEYVGDCPLILAEGLRLVQDGCSQELLEQFMINYLSSVNRNAPELPELIIYAQGVMMLAKGTNPQMAKKVLFGLFGAEMYDVDVSFTLSETKSREERCVAPEPKSSGKITKNTQQRVLNELLEDETAYRAAFGVVDRINFAMALMGESDEIIKKVLMGFNKDDAEMIWGVIVEMNKHGKVTREEMIHAKEKLRTVAKNIIFGDMGCLYGL